MPSSIISDQVLFYSLIGAFFVLLGQSLALGTKEQDKDPKIGSFLLALGLFFFAFAVYARGCNACEPDGECTRPPFKPSLALVALGGLAIFTSSLFLGSRPSQRNNNNGESENRAFSRTIAAIIFVVGWGFVAGAISMQTREQKSKAIFASLTGVGLLLVGQLWLQSQDTKNLVNGPGWIFSSMGVAFLAVSNSLD